MRRMATRRRTAPAERTRKGPGDKGDAAPGARADEAYSKILEAIRSGALKPGARVREAQMAEWLGMSRTPVRQAIQRLEAEGLLTLAPRAGLGVTQVDAELVGELYYMREILEGTAARLAAESGSRGDLHVLEELVQAELEAAPDPQTAAESNRRFHTQLYRAARNRFLLKSLQAVHDSLALLGRSTLSNRARARQAAEEHARIVEAIAARQPEAAEALMREHIRSAYRERLRLLFGAR
jgi:DNA-binding GntR family transcriptional regulator